ncbi:2 iron, 2 sulfur cluster binding [Tyrophagus putrescentiae]|nr:2 iron, 2 sulfur cluster binding [Tyrophagus putrescentiae]
MKSQLVRLTTLAARRSLSTTTTGATEITEKGLIFDVKPVKFTPTEGKTYFWCSCGESKKQPFCDGTHKRPDIKLRPVKWECTEVKPYFICNCKQTNRAPFCDATHKRAEVLKAFEEQQQKGEKAPETPN